jgi:hypothetical protein
LVSAERIASDARWLPVDFDPRSRSVGFVQTGYDGLAAQPFLDARWDRRALPQARVAVPELLAAMRGREPARCNIVWHTAFCCSTLLARALNAPGRSLALCEPKLMVDLADTKRAGMFLLDRELAALSDAALALLARPIQGCTVALKPAPAANYLLAEAEASIDGRRLVLFSDCRSFVISLARKGDEGWQYARAMFAVLLRSGHLAPDWHGPRLWDLNDLQIAAFVWHMQVDLLRRSTADATRVRSLDCDALLDDPEGTLRALDAFFGLGLGDAHIAGSASLFRHNAKNPAVPYDARRRREEQDTIAARLGAELDRAVAWSYDAYPATPGGAPLPAPLVATTKAYRP